MQSINSPSLKRMDWPILLGEIVPPIIDLCQRGIGESHSSKIVQNFDLRLHLMEVLQATCLSLDSGARKDSAYEEDDHLIRAAQFI